MVGASVHVQLVDTQEGAINKLYGKIEGKMGIGVLGKLII